MNRLKTNLAVSVVLILTAAVLAGIFAKPVWAQVRAALVRDVDNPALAPFRADVNFSFLAIGDQFFLTTVPTGKRLVIEHISYGTSGPTSEQLIFAALRTGQFGPVRERLEIHPVHASADSGFFLQDASLPVKLYFEPGEEIWVAVSKSAGFATRQFEIHAEGYYVTP